MAYIRKCKTREELSRIRAEAGRKGAITRKANGTMRGGRPKGSPNKGPSKAQITRTIQVHDDAYKVIVKCAGFIHKPIISFMDDVAQSLRDKNPALFELQDNLRV